MASRTSNYERQPTVLVHRLVGFDFDLTLTSRRVYGRRDFYRGIEGYLFGGSKRVQMLRRHLQGLKSHNCTLYVITWNFADIVQECLDYVGLLNLFEGVFDRPVVERNGGYRDGKRALMQKFGMNKWRESQGSGILCALFVDDSIEIVQNFQELLSGQVRVRNEENMDIAACRIHHVQTRGITEQDFEQIYHLLELPYNASESVR